MAWARRRTSPPSRRRAMACSYAATPPSPFVWRRWLSPRRRSSSAINIRVCPAYDEAMIMRKIALVLLLACALTVTAAKPQDQALFAEIEKADAELFAAFNAHDADKLATFF